MMEKYCTRELFLVLRLEISFFPETVEWVFYVSERAPDLHIGMETNMVWLRDMRHCNDA